MFMGPRNWCQGLNSASLWSLAGRYDNPIPTRCLAPIDFLKIPALDSVPASSGIVEFEGRQTKQFRIMYVLKTAVNFYFYCRLHKNGDFLLPKSCVVAFLSDKLTGRFLCSLRFVEFYLLLLAVHFFRRVSPNVLTVCMVWMKNKLVWTIFWVNSLRFLE